MAKLIFQFNEFDKYDYKIVVNNSDVSEHENCININQSGIHKIRIIAFKTPKIQNKFHLDFKQLIPYYSYHKELKNDFDNMKEKCLSWDNYIIYADFEFSVSIDDTMIKEKEIIINIDFDLENNKNYYGSYDFNIVPHIATNSEAEITNVHFNKSKILKKCRYKRNQTTLCLIKYVLLLLIGFAFFMINPNFRSFSFNLFLTIAFELYAVCSFIISIYKLNRYVNYCLSDYLDNKNPLC